MPRIDLDALPPSNATGYPEPFAEAVQGRWYRPIAKPAGLTQMGARQVLLRPGAWSSQRHWHTHVDELLVMVSGEAILVEDDGETVLRPGDICAWLRGANNGHHLQNRSQQDCVFVVVSAGDDQRDTGHYPDIDLRFGPSGFSRKDGTPYPGKS